MTTPAVFKHLSLETGAQTSLQEGDKEPFRTGAHSHADQCIKEGRDCSTMPSYQAPTGPIPPAVNGRFGRLVLGEAHFTQGASFAGLAS